MIWLTKTKDILDEPADVLICSANVSLNLSGGVGGAILQRHGISMQNQLHRQIAGRSSRTADPGEVFITHCPEMPYKAVLHAVAVDGWYRSSEQLISEVVTKAFRIAVSFGAGKIALAALATGYGNLTLQQFVAGLKRVDELQFPTVDEVVICLTEEDRTAELLIYFAE